jgi:uncharacterized membrane protein YidH (DUF202 family)
MIHHHIASMRGSGTVITCKPEVGAFNIGATSGLYSTVAGVMAGFAFVALFYLITTESPAETDEDRYNLAAQALGSGFLALLLACINWAVLAGEKVTGGRASTIEVFASCAFVLAAVQLFYAILVLIRIKQDADNPLHGFFQMVGGAFLCPFVFLFALLGATDYLETGPEPWAKDVFIFGLALLVNLFTSVVRMLPRERWTRAREALRLLSRRHATSDTALSFWSNPSYVTMVGGVVGLTATSIFAGTSDQCKAGSPVFIVMALTLTCAGLINQATRFFYPPDKFTPSPTGQSQERDDATSGA